MPQRSYLWSSRLCGVVLYSLVFVFTCHFWQVGPGPLRGQPELLLFMLPGIVIALLQVESPLKSTLMMGLWGTLVGTVLLNNSLFDYSSTLFVLAWCLSALFWAGCGALLVRLMQIVLASLQ
ncbi:inner membrane protein YbjM [Pantoea sp. NSTU24]|uniref:inner membrane protein YbjM n=1 Tax=Pantoea sp. NSTU24 TaxID=3391144 RepID=UPI003D0857D8